MSVPQQHAAGDVDAKGLEVVETIFRDLRDRRFLKWIFDERGDACFIANFADGEPLKGLDLEVQGEIKASWQAIISKALTPASQAHLRVKPLEWKQVALDSHEWNWLAVAKAETPFGTYSIEKHTKGFLRVMFGTQRVSHFEPGQRAEAEASAQRDLEARIRAALAATATEGSDRG
ncbi:hypothetical protein I7G59_09835 [Sinorhizobium meliloti]|uniref:hypothetical protein n=1 Tax=Rhizobium meliloti TaxID=382 RepID=UPI0023807329|nr:hypothetical protein [Sinorhizobium meliloti]MDE3797627.1 hypothetical protein [Sinorhizobium meliloti]